MDIVTSDVDAYAKAHTSPETDVLQQIATETALMPGANMLTGRIEGRFLRLLVQLSQAKRVLEIGTFTGYSALSMAEALPEDGVVITCEKSPETAKIAAANLAKSADGRKVTIKVGDAIETIKALEGLFDMVFIDADKKNYPNYYELVLPMLNTGGLIVVDNALWSGKVVDPQDDQTKAIDSLNQIILADDRVENVMLTVRDGIHIAIKK